MPSKVILSTESEQYLFWMMAAALFHLCICGKIEFHCRGQRTFELICLIGRTGFVSICMWRFLNCCNLFPNIGTCICRYMGLLSRVYLPKCQEKVSYCANVLCSLRQKSYVRKVAFKKKAKKKQKTIYQNKNDVNVTIYKDTIQVI